MKTYDEIVVNVVEATAVHRRKVRKIQKIAATSAMCAVCVFGLSVYMNLEPQQSLPEPSETETQTVTETGFAALPTETEETVSTDIPETDFTEATFPATTAEESAAVSSQEESRFIETRPPETSAAIPDTTNPPKTEESVPVTTAQTTRNSTRPTSEQTEAWTTGRTVTTPPVRETTTFYIPNIDYTEPETTDGDTGQAPTDPWMTTENTTVSDTTTTTTTTATTIVITS